jgi:hypothetical protein
MTIRRRLSKSIERDVLMASRRRCCLCVFLTGRDEVRKGQIAHLNHDRNDSRFENLVFLCLEHHDDYDGRTSQSKGFSIDEVRAYRDRLYDRNPTPKAFAAHAALIEAAELTPLSEISDYQALRRRLPEQLKYTSEPWRSPLWQIANEPEFFAYKAGNGADGICLVERIDIPDGRIVVICIETAGNPGNSITNCVEELCFQVSERFEIPPASLVWIEHYDDDELDEWRMVTFERRPPNDPFEYPQWTTMTPSLWHDLYLRPKKKLRKSLGHFESKVQKLFHWPKEAINH